MAVHVPPVHSMDDETLMRHLEEQHPGDLKLEFKAEPDREERRLRNPEVWRTYHDAVHRLAVQPYQHEHTGGPMEYDRNKLIYDDRPEQIWVVVRAGDSDHVAEAHNTPEGAALAEARGDLPWGTEAVEVTLHRPSLRPIYGGPTLLEALWNEMDSLMERLMTGQTNEDGGDRFRAEELAWVIAIVTNAYNPSMDMVRAEAMTRWNEAQAE